jgi:hypothetical protein
MEIEHGHDLISQSLARIAGHALAVAKAEWKYLKHLSRRAERGRLGQVRSPLVQIQHHQRGTMSADAVRETVAVEVDLKGRASHASTLPPGGPKRAHRAADLAHLAVTRIRPEDEHRTSRGEAA